MFRGEGERGFCAGADIKERRGAETSLQVRQRMQGARWIESLDRTAKPVIAAIHGFCRAAGSSWRWPATSGLPRPTWCWRCPRPASG